MPSNSLTDILGAPELAPATPAAVPAPAAPPPLPAESDPQLIARAALAEGDPNNPTSWKAVAGVIQNRMAKSGLTASQVLAEPGAFEAYGNGHIQSVDTSSPQYQAALAAVQSVKPGDVPYDSFYSPSIVAARGHGTPPFDPKTGTMVGTQLFGTGGYTPSQSGAQLANTLGLTPDEQKAIAAADPPAPTTPGGKTKGPGDFTVGPNAAPMTAAQEAFYRNKAQTTGLEQAPLAEGSADMPYALMPGRPVPTMPGVHYVDYDGVEHVNPGNRLLAMASGALSGLGQGAIMDTLASAQRLGLGGGDPTLTALSQTQGGPGAFDEYNAAKAGFQQQQNDYHIANLGNPGAQFGRFVGQAIPATVAASAAPELEAPAALGRLGELAAPVATNALRGTAAAATNVGANPNQSVAGQLGTGALAGAVLPPLVDAAGNTGVKLLTGSPISPNVRTLADKAINEYGIPLRGSQIAGVENPSLAVKDSNLITAPGSGFAANNKAQQTAFTRAVASTFGANSDSITPTVMSQARSDLGDKFEQFGQSHNITDTDALQTRLGGIVKDAQSVMPASEVSPILNQIQNIADVIQTNPDGSRILPGDAYLALTRTGAPLDRVMQAGDSNLRYYAGQIHDALSDAIAADATPEEVADFANTRLQYKNLMTIKGLAAKGGIDGTISPTQLQGVVNRSFDDRAFSGAGPLGDLADIGQAFMKQPQNSFTAQRAAEIAGRNWLPAALGAAAGGEYAMGGHLGAIFHDPSLALQLGAGAAATKGAGYVVNALSGLRNGPLGARALMSNSQGSVRSALEGVGNFSRPAEVPLSTLAALRGLPASTAGNNSVAVGSNAQ